MNHGHKYLLLLLLALAAPLRAQITAPTASPGATATATPLPVSARQHADELARAHDALRAAEDGPKRTFNPLRPLEQGRVVTRGDGAALRVDGEEWKQRRLDAVDAGGYGNGTFGTGDGKAGLSRVESQRARESLQARREAVEAWGLPRDGKYFQPDAGATQAILNWQKSGRIETGPPAWQAKWHEFVRWVYGQIEALGKWISGLFSRTGNVRAPNVDVRKIEIGFYVFVAGVLGGAAWLAWRALGGKVGRRGRRSRDVILEGEDAALLRLPPDELLDRAHGFAREGNFREALRHRYLSLLLLLDARGVWRYDRRRTNWEHIARLKSAGPNRAGLAEMSDLTLRFDRVRYGNEPCDAGAWGSFDAQAQQVLEMLSRTSAASRPAAGVAGEARR